VPSCSESHKKIGDFLQWRSINAIHMIARRVASGWIGWRLL